MLVQSLDHFTPCDTSSFLTHIGDVTYTQVAEQCDMLENNYTFLLLLKLIQFFSFLNPDPFSNFQISLL